MTTMGKARLPMQAVRFDEYGDPDVLRDEDVQVPVPGPGELRIRVASTAFIVDFGRQRRLNALATGDRPPPGV